MPLYEYACTECAHHFDVRHGADDRPQLSCPACQGKVAKVFHAAGIIFKGSGWYVTDSASKKHEPEKKTEPTKKEPDSTPSKETVTTSA